MPKLSKKEILDMTRKRMHLTGYWADIPDDLLYIAIISRSDTATLGKIGIEKFETLEFYGDRVLNLCAVHLLMSMFKLSIPLADLGEFYSYITRNNTLTRFMIELRLCFEIHPDLIGIHLDRHNRCGDSFEAIMGLMYYWGYFINNDDKILMRIYEWFSTLLPVRRALQRFKSRPAMPLIPWKHKIVKIDVFMSYARILSHIAKILHAKIDIENIDNDTINIKINIPAGHCGSSSIRLEESGLKRNAIKWLIRDIVKHNCVHINLDENRKIPLPDTNNLDRIKFIADRMHAKLDIHDAGTYFTISIKFYDNHKKYAYAGYSDTDLNDAAMDLVYILVDEGHIDIGSLQLKPTSEKSIKSTTPVYNPGKDYGFYTVNDVLHIAEGLKSPYSDANDIDNISEGIIQYLTSRKYLPSTVRYTGNDFNFGELEAIVKALQDKLNNHYKVLILTSRTARKNMNSFEIRKLLNLL